VRALAIILTHLCLLLPACCSGGNSESPPNGCYTGSKPKGKPSALAPRAAEEAAAPAEGSGDGVAARPGRARGPHQGAEPPLKEANGEPEAGQDAQKPLPESAAAPVKAAAAPEWGPGASAVEGRRSQAWGLSVVAGEPPRQQRSNSPLQGTQGTQGQRGAGVGEAQWPPGGGSAPGGHEQRQQQ